MELSKDQVLAFIEVLFGHHITTSESAEGDPLSPLVVAFMKGVLPETVNETSLRCAVFHPGDPGMAGTPAARQADLFCDFLEAVVRMMREKPERDDVL